jgi:hypothetical protein
LKNGTVGIREISKRYLFCLFPPIKNSFISFKYWLHTKSVERVTSKVYQIRELQPMTKQEPSKLKMIWLSPKKLAFEWEKTFGEHFDWGYEVLGKKKILVTAEEGKDLFFLDGENSGYSKFDMLCCFCENSISLGRFGHASTCLLGKYIRDVTLCKDFAPGHSFGEDKDRDMGERLKMAENVLPKIQWQDCWDCKFFNTKNVYRIIGNDENGEIIENPSARFCEILHRLPEPGYGRVCKNFEVSQNPQKRARYEGRKRWLRDYLAELKDLEKLQKK